jgi:non-lysosomal glucosylceramidase
MKGIVFGQNCRATATNEWEGELAITALETAGVEVIYQTTWLASGDGKEV